MDEEIKTANPLGYKKISKLLRSLAIPAIIANLVNALYNVVDQIFIGQGIGYLGNVSLIKSSESGENRVIFLLNDGSMINEPLMRKNTSGIECWGFEDSKILRIGIKTFDKIMSKDYILARNCMLEMEKRIRRLYRQLKNLT